MKTLVIIPAFNEQGNIEELIGKLHAQPMKLDIVVVNDHSTDRTSQICEQLGVSTVDLPCNLGIGGAVQTGYLYAYKYGYDYAIQVDGDGQHDPANIGDIMKPLLKGQADMSIGSRYITKQGFQSSVMRRMGIRYFSKLIELVVKQKVTDPTSGFRACNAKVIELFSRYYPADYPEPESIVFMKRNGLRICEVPVTMKERTHGVSSIKSFRSVYYMIKVSIAIVIDKLRKNVEVSS